MMSGYPHDATPPEVLAYLRATLTCRAPDWLVGGNLRADDVLRALTWVDMHLAKWRSIYATVEEYERCEMLIVPGELAAKMRELL